MVFSRYITLSGKEYDKDSSSNSYRKQKHSQASIYKNQAKANTELGDDFSPSTSFRKANHHT
jgi:hypothetical protein